MSVIGPRPALWNQDVLVAERDKYGANDVKPGLTGWAQINGRDELEIPVKAKLDGEYVEKESFLFDILYKLYFRQNYNEPIRFFNISEIGSRFFDFICSNVRTWENVFHIDKLDEFFCMGNYFDNRVRHY